MGQLVDIPGLVDEAYSKVVNYIRDISGTLSDPSKPPGELFDYIEGVQVHDLVRAIQARINQGASNADVGLMNSYRDIQATLTEYNFRLMDRDAYWKDSEIELNNMDRQLLTNSANNIGHMKGR